MEQIWQSPSSTYEKSTWHLDKPELFIATLDQEVQNNFPAPKLFNSWQQEVRKQRRGLFSRDRQNKQQSRSRPHEYYTFIINQTLNILHETLNSPRYCEYELWITQPVNSINPH